MAIRSSVSLPAVHPFSGMDIASALAERAGRFGSRWFLIWEPGTGAPAQWTYAQFAAEVDAIAAGLVAKGVARGDAVILLLDNSPAFLFCWFACARLGAVAIDTNTRYSADELAYALEQTDAIGVITDESRAPRFDAIIGARWLVTIDDATGTCPALRGAIDTLPAPMADANAALCVQFTSGTTARPKAVLYTHANALWGARVGATHARHTTDDVCLVYAPLFHTAALSWQMLSIFWVGGTVVLLPKFSASRFWDISLRHRCTHTNLLGLMMQVLGEQPVPEHRYRVWQFGLEVPPIESRYGVRLFNCWGMTEVVTNVIIGDHDHPTDAGAIGRASPEYSIRIVRDDGSECAIGETGDLRVGGVRGLSLFAEYVGDPGATADAFDEHGFFRTGDCVRVLPSGAIAFVGRAKDMLKVGGENVAAAEIERVLLTEPGIIAAAVVGRRDRMLDEVPVAFVVIDPDVADPARIADTAIARCREQLADFKVPRNVYVVDELPEAMLGKIAKGQLRARAEELAAGA